jgi:hypothetical protein
MRARNRARRVNSYICVGLTEMRDEVGAVRLPTRHAATPNGNRAPTFEASCTGSRSGSRSGEKGAGSAAFFHFAGQVG